jgi:hypothetical protein
MLGDFNAKLRRDDIRKPAVGNESLLQVGNDNGVRIVNFAVSKNLAVNSTMFLHRNIHKYIWTCPGGKTHNQIHHILIDRRFHSGILEVGFVSGADCDTDGYLVVRGKLAVSKQRAQEFDKERFSLRQPRELEVMKQYQIKISKQVDSLGELK